MKTIPALAVLSSALCLHGETAAHGGQYRGPTTTSGRIVTPGGPGGPGVPGRPLGPTTGGAIAPGAPAAGVPDATRWQVWWELNKDPYLRAPKFAFDPSLPEVVRKDISDKQKIDVILPALKAALDQTSNQHITSACLIALGKIGLDHPSFKILDECRKRFKRGNQEIQEVAALSMGLSRKPEAIDDLAALLSDSTKGQRWVGKSKVSPRTRSFAAYGLGLLARGDADIAVKVRVFEVLKKVLEDKRLTNRDVIIAVLNGFRLLDPRPAKGAQHRRLQWQCLETLEAYEEVEASKSRQAVKAHVLPALGRLLGRGGGSDRDRVKQSVTDILTSRRRRHATLYQSAVLALGQMLVSVEESPDEAPFAKALRRHCDTTRDQLTGNFGLIAMGQIGGEDNMEHLLKTLRTGKRDTQGWAALALGLLAFHAPHPVASVGTAQVGKAPRDLFRERIGAELRKALLRTNNRDVRSALALALGLAGYEKAAPDMRKLLKKYRKVEEFAGYLAMGLALMEDKASGSVIEEIMAASSRKPLLMTQTALALARLRHPGASITLRAILRTGGKFRTITLASTASAMGYLADPGNVDPLVRILADESNNKLVRAFAAVALGSMGENDAITWSAWIAMNMNYSATVESLSNGSSGILDIL